MADTPTAENRLPNHTVIAFGRAVSMVPQQKKNRLVGTVTSKSPEPGDRYTMEGLGLSEPKETFDDYGDTPASEPLAKHRRVGFYKTYEDDRPVGTREKAEALIDPTNGTTQAMGFGMERRRDYTILKGLCGRVAYYDKEGDIAYKDFPAGQAVAHDYNKLTKGAADGDAVPASAVVGLTVPKLRRVKVLASQGEFESMHPLHIAVTQEDLEFLKTSSEFGEERHVVNQIGALADGETETFMGFKFIKVPPSLFDKAGLKLSGGTDRYRLPVWYPEGVHYSERPLVTTKVWERSEKKFRWWAYYENQDSFLREYDEAVFAIDAERLG